jgi:hypothetical protein
MLKPCGPEIQRQLLICKSGRVGFQPQYFDKLRNIFSLSFLQLHAPVNIFGPNLSNVKLLDILMYILCTAQDWLQAKYCGFIGRRRTKMLYYIPPVITAASSRALATGDIPAGPVSLKSNFLWGLATKFLYVI